MSGNTRQAQKLAHEHQRGFVQTLPSGDLDHTVIFSKTAKSNTGSAEHREYQKHVSQRGPKAPGEDGGILEQAKPDVTFQKELQQARLAKGGMKQADVAKALNVKASVINDWESGRSVPTGQERSKLGKVLGVRFGKTQKVHPMPVVRFS